MVCLKLSPDHKIIIKGHDCVNGQDQAPRPYICDPGFGINLIYHQREAIDALTGPEGIARVYLCTFRAETAYDSACAPPGAIARVDKAALCFAELPIESSQGCVAA